MLCPDYLKLRYDSRSFLRRCALDHRCRRFPGQVKFAMPFVSGKSLEKTSRQEDIVITEDLYRRDFSPCGVTLNLGSPQLFKYPGRFFHYFLDVDPQIVEGLVVPVFVNRQGRGTIWIATHDEGHHFTLTESKSMSSLASFTAAAIDLMERDANHSRPAGHKARTPAARRSQ
jgi:hypothetical protein